MKLQSTTISTVMSVIATLIALTALAVSWNSNRPSLIVDDWRIHDRREFGTTRPGDITTLPWGMTFGIKLSGGTNTTLQSVSTSAHSPFNEVQVFPTEAPHRMVGGTTPYTSRLYNIDPCYTQNAGDHDRTVLVRVQIKYTDERLFMGWRTYTDTFYGKFTVGGIDNGGWYIRAQQWDRPETVEGIEEAIPSVAVCSKQGATTGD